MAKIHHSSIIDIRAELDEDVEVGPFCMVGPHVRIGAGTVLESHVVVKGLTTIGRNNRFFQGAAIGCEPQDKKYKGEETYLEIGDDNVVRENCTISTGTIQDQSITRVGSRNLLMANGHVAHDCVLGNDLIIANNVALAGHVHVDDCAVIGGQTGVHQFVHIGTRSMTGGVSGLTHDLPPYVICSGNPAKSFGLNLVGLRRAGFSSDTIGRIKGLYKALYMEGLMVAQAIERMDAQIADAPEEIRPILSAMRDFVANNTRGIVRP